MDRMNAAIAALMAIYLVGTLSLAFAIDRTFLLNDAIAIVVWLVFGLVLLVTMSRGSRQS